MPYIFMKSYSFPKRGKYVDSWQRLFVICSGRRHGIANT